MQLGHVTGVFCLQSLWMNSSTLMTMAIGSGSVSRQYPQNVCFVYMALLLSSDVIIGFKIYTGMPVFRQKPEFRPWQFIFKLYVSVFVCTNWTILDRMSVLYKALLLSTDGSVPCVEYYVGFNLVYQSISIRQGDCKTTACFSHQTIMCIVKNNFIAYVSHFLLKF